MHQFNHPAGDAPVVEVRHLCKTFVLHQQGGIRIQALQDVNFDVRAGECVALHGPSGAGKSTLLKTLYGNYLPSSGQVIVRCEDCETDMATASTRAISRVRRECIGYVSQFLRVIPRVSALDLVAEPLLDAGEDRETALDAAQKMLTRLNLPERLWHVAPATFSGGEQQRVNIARALSMEPKIIVCDEPVSALDVSIQAQVINLFRRLQKQFNLTYVFISHDLGIIKYISDRIMIMYLGRVMEFYTSEGIYADPKHPYTQALLSAIPPESPFEKKERLPLTGDIPSPIGDQVGCPLAGRCPHCTERCKKEIPKLVDTGDGHMVACFLYE